MDLADVIMQVLIGVLGCLSIILVTSTEEKVRKWACISGLSAEPFWLWTSIENEQWGIMVLCSVYTVRWSQVLYRDWFRDKGYEGN